MSNRDFIVEDSPYSTADAVNEARIRASLDEVPTKTAFVDWACEFLEEHPGRRVGNS